MLLLSFLLYTHIRNARDKIKQFFLFFHLTKWWIGMCKFSFPLRYILRILILTNGVVLYKKCELLMLYLHIFSFVLLVLFFLSIFVSFLLIFYTYSFKQMVLYWKIKCVLLMLYLYIFSFILLVLFFLSIFAVSTLKVILAYGINFFINFRCPDIKSDSGLWYQFFCWFSLSRR
jgi:hypothetical protein